MSAEPISAEEPGPFLATYVGAPGDTWTGSVASLDVHVSADTLEVAREELEKAVSSFVKSAQDDGKEVPDPVPSGCVTVAERMEVSTYSTVSGKKRWVHASSKPSRIERTSPYRGKSGAYRLLHSVVLMVDELGTTSRMGEGLSEDTLEERAELLARAREWLGDPDTEGLESLVMYTDNLLHGAPIGEVADATSRLGSTLIGASHYQLELALAGTILRGGIAVGAHHQSESMVAGPAMIEAHRLEAEFAEFPRILLSPDAVEIVAQGLSHYQQPVRSEFAQQLLIDQDGQLFVSYLNASEEYDDGLAAQLLVLERHRSRLIDGLRSTRRRSRPRSKWLWLAAYHDYYIARLALPRRLRIRKWRGWRRRFSPIV